MTDSPAIIFGPLQVPSSAGAIYTVPAARTVVLTRLVATNISASGRTLRLWIVRAGQTRGDGNIITGAAAAGQSLSAGPSTPLVLAECAGLVLAAGDAIHALADAASSINLVGSGWTTQ